MEWRPLTSTLANGNTKSTTLLPRPAAPHPKRAARRWQETRRGIGFSSMGVFRPSGSEYFGIILIRAMRVRFGERLLSRLTS